MKEIIFAGFGGQGVLTSGLVIAYTAARKGYNAIWMPAYGPTMRGGKANCVTKVAENETEKIGCPVMEHADCIVAMNEPALDYLKFCKKDAVIICNEAMVPKDYKFPEGAEVIFIDFPAAAQKVNNEKGMNIVAAAVVIKKFGLFDEDFAIESMCKFWEEKGKGKLNDLNIAAMKAGFELI